jgi:SAM-dependent methyltransferase
VSPDHAPAPESPGTVIGNHCHKYTTGNPAIRFLTRRFLLALHEILDEVERVTPHARVLEVGCGEGEIAGLLHHRWGDVTGLDLPDAGLRADWAGVEGPHFLHADAERMPFPDDHFDVVVAVEVLEHLRDPVKGLQEMARVARRHLVLSVPREPIFRMGNLLTGRHVRALGNTPGHLNHWSSASFQRFVGQAATIRTQVRPLPWTIAWAEVAAGA